MALNFKHQNSLFEYNSQYECGFEPFGSRNTFDIQYFIIGLLYLVFDAELVILIP